ncbi:glycoside hydrolase [Diplogelasinospora grovesii]|uniref:alpha-1,2-Mannosidase n=1 Tax=Diplogelasinospora grovesii TaxID=303347 RepID=A0AAN6N7Z6_9PEZI|nr:glycoside hydrolase [Diplogelasinospora grovesii]
MPPMRRWRALVAVAAAWMMICWYFLSDSNVMVYTGADGGSQWSFGDGPKKQQPGSGKHWSKLPDRNPVPTSLLRTIPTGAPETPIPRIQKSPPAEDTVAKEVRQARLTAVKQSFQHSWNGYKKHAWLSDEVTPLSGKSKDPFGGWAATLVDALDTLWIMGMKEDFREAVLACEQIDFTTTQTTSINVFETTIRYLGGFLAAYELSGQQYPQLLKKAVEVGDLLMCAFDTPNRMPISRWNWEEYVRGATQTAPRQVLVSEIGSSSLEFTKLSQLTGDMRYYDAVQRISDEFEKGQNTTKLPGMWPIVVNAARPAFNEDNAFTLGGMSDSLYEYFPKQYLMLGGALEQPRKLYEGFIDVAKKHLFRRALNPDNIPLLISGDVRVTGTNSDKVVTTPKGQHLTCFVGGMVGIASRIFERPDDLDVAVQITDACVWSYSSTPSGIGPEIWTFAPCGLVSDSQTGEKCKWTDQKWKDAVRQYWRPRNADEIEHETEADKKAADQQITSIIEGRRLPPGFIDIPDKKYILRPEAIESVFIMYRLTGDKQWMEKAWNMFQAIDKHTHTDIAAASLNDVTFSDPTQVDSMESFWLAETLKYFYLVFADWDTVDLDQWVLNTEAHPLRRPDVQS